MRRLLLAVLLIFCGGNAFAQNQPVYQVGGKITRGHAAVWQQSGGIADAGGAAGSAVSGSGYLTELGITATGTPFCINDALTNAAGGYHQLCFGANALGGGLFSYNNYGAASPLPWQVCLNGVCYGFPPTGNGNILGPNSSSIDDIVAFNNTAGTLVKDAGVPWSAVAAGRMVGYPSTTWSTDATSITAWHYIVPQGWPAFTCASTQTQCFQEALTYRATATNGTATSLSLDLYCPGGNGGFIQANTGIDTGVIRQNEINGHGCSINFASSITGDTFKINTMLDGSRLVWNGQIICNNTSPTSGTACVTLHPTTIPPFEGAAGLGIINSLIELGAIAGGGVAVTPAGSMLAFDASSGSIQGVTVRAGELNCNGAGTGAGFKNAIEFKGATLTTGVFWNPEIKIHRWHQCINGLFQNTTNATNYNNNRYIVGVGSPNASSSTGVGYDFAGNNENLIGGIINNNEGSYQYGLKIETGASAYTVKLNIVGASGSPNYVDSGSADVLDFSNTLIRNAATIFNYPPAIGGGTVAALPVSPTIGSVAYVADATSNSEGNIIAGGGSNKAMIWWDGTNWRVMGPPIQQATSNLSDTVAGACGSGSRVWTPVLNFGGLTTGITYSAQVGCYNAMSKMNVGEFNITLTSKGSATGNATITGLPVGETGSFFGSCVVSYYVNLATITSSPYGNIAASASVVDLYQAGSTGNATLVDGNFSNTSQLKGTCTWLGQ